MDQPPGDGTPPNDDLDGEPRPSPEASPLSGNPLAAKDTEAGPEATEGAGAFFKELPVLILIAFGLALLIKTFLVQAFFIPSESMVPTLEINDRVLVNKLVYRMRDPRRGEIVVFVGERDDEVRSFGRRVREFLFEGFGGATSAERDFIKRVIALPGETIRIRKGRVTVTTASGEKIILEEPYLADEPDESSFGPLEIPAGQFFVMGDNRPNSSDSRSALGPIHKSDIIGRAFIRIWPMRRMSILRRPDYTPPPADESPSPQGSAVPFLPVMLPARRRHAA